MLRFVIAVSDSSGINIDQLQLLLERHFDANEYKTFLLSDASLNIRSDPSITIGRVIRGAKAFASLAETSFPGAQFYIGVRGDKILTKETSDLFVVGWMGKQRNVGGIVSLSPKKFDGEFLNVCVEHNGILGTIPDFLNLAAEHERNRIPVLIKFVLQTIDEIKRS